MATGMAGLFGGAGPTAYVNSLYGPIQAQLAKQQQARVGTLNDLVGSILASLKAPQPDVYGAAAQDQTAAANGAAQTLARVNPDAQTQAMLRAIGAPQSQQDAVGGQNNVTFNGQGALGQYVGGALPAGVFAQDQAARQTYLNSLPATVGLGAIQGLGHLNLLASQENANLSSQKAGAQQKALSDLADYVQKNQGLKLQAQKTAFDQNLATAKYKTGVDEFNARQKFSYTQAQWRQANADRAYGLSYKRYQLAEQRAAQINANGGLTSAQKNALAPKVQDYTKGLYEGVPGHVTYPNSSNGLSAPRIDSWKQKPMTYQQAIKTLIRRYPSLGASGSIQAADGLYQPGEGGRPLAPVDLTARAIQGPTLGQAGKSGNPLVDYASRYIGVPYSWGGGSPSGPTKGIGRGANTIGFDCSSFIQAVMVHSGYKNFPRTTYAQAKLGQPVPLSGLKPGDAVFTRPGKLGPGHVGLYIGNGMVQESPHTGDVNKIISLKDFLTGGFVTARRYLP